MIFFIVIVNVAFILQNVNGNVIRHDENESKLKILSPIVQLRSDNSDVIQRKNLKKEPKELENLRILPPLQDGKKTSNVLTLTHNAPPLPGEKYGVNTREDINHYVTKHNLNDVRTKSYPTSKSSIICNNKDMYGEDVPRFNRFQFEENEKSFDTLKRRLKSFATPQYEQIQNYARSADATPHFTHHHHTPPHHYTNKNVNININKHGLHDNPTGHVIKHGIHNLNPYEHHSSITVNKHYDNFGLPQIQQNIQIARETNTHDTDTLQSPYLIYAPHISKHRYRRSTIKDEPYHVFEMILKKEAEIVDNNNNQKLVEKDKSRKMRSLNKVNKRRSKRATNIPFFQLLTDPNKKIDMMKTLDNIGTITKKSFNNNKAPMYHLRNMLGSAKDVVISSLKVVPQDFIIPSQYKILDKNAPEYEAFLTYQQEAINKDNNESVIVGAAIITEEDVPKPTTLLDKIRQKLNLKSRFGGSSESDSSNFVDTFQKVGTLFRNSILASQNTLKHAGDVAHSARKAITTAKLAAPTILLPYAKAPALLFDDSSIVTRASFNEQPDKIVVVAPRVLEIAEDKNEPHPADYEDEFLQFGHITDALGLTKPVERRINLAKVVLHHKMTPKPPVLEARMQSRTNLESSLINNTRPYFVYSEIHSPNYDEDEFNDSNELNMPTKEIVSHSRTEKREIPLEEVILRMKEEFQSIKNDVDALKERVSQPKDGSTFKLLQKPPTLNKLTNKKTDNVNEEDPKTEVDETANDGDIPEDTKGLISVKKSPNKLSDLLDKLLQLKSEKFKRANNGALTDEEMQKNVDDNIKDVFGRPPLQDNVLGVGLPLDKNLFKPFMGQPSETDLKGFLEENNDDLKLLNVLENNNGNDDAIVGAINPFMYKKYFKEPLKLKATNNGTDGENVGFEMPKKLLKPFLGGIDYDVIYDFGDTPNNDDFDMDNE